MEIHRQRDPNVVHERFVTFQILQSSRAGPVDSLSPFLLDLNKKKHYYFSYPFISYYSCCFVSFLRVERTRQPTRGMYSLNTWVACRWLGQRQAQAGDTKNGNNPR